MNEALLTDVLTQPLLVDASYIYAYYMQLHNMMQGKAIPADYDHSKARAALKSFSVSSSSLVRMNGYTNLVEAPKDSVAVIQLKGPVIKNSQFCGPRGTLDIANDFLRAKANPNIIGAVFDIESGGGMALAVKPLADAMLSFREEKPIIGLGGDILASAGYYLAAYCDEIIMQHPRAIVGSIGTMIAFADAKAMLEKQGVVFHEIYATESTSKNKTFNEALKGNYAPIITGMLDPINGDFHADVKEQRADKLTTLESLIFKGETYMASVAKELGLVDALGNLQDAVSRVEDLSGSYKSNKQLQTPNNHMKIENVVALAGIATPTQEQIDLANADLTAAGITDVTLVQESFITEAANTTEQNALLTTQVANLTKEKGTAEASLLTATNKITALEGKVEAFGKNAGALHQQAKGKDEEIETDEDNNPENIIANLPHNKFAASYLS
jgi:ClpP class serine protease